MKRHVVVALALVTLAGSSVTSQHSAVETDRVKHGQEWVPRFAIISPSADDLVVPAGQTVDLAALSYDAIEVAGTLRCPRASHIAVTVRSILILPGGTFDCGTASDPVTGTVQIEIADMPIDTTVDPFQWGNGIVNFGTRLMHGIEKTSFVELAGDALAGSAVLQLASAPVGWQAGDEVLLPDMEQRSSPRRSQNHVIESVSGSTVALTEGLEFDRRTVYRFDGPVALRPRVANLTRNIVIRSQNPDGVRGHIADIGPESSWDTRYVQHVGLGRTTFASLDSTSADLSHIGTNQVGKYAEHKHHAGSSLAVRQVIGNSYQGTQGSKWAITVHATHDSLVEDNVVVDYQGGGIVTEDGYEVRNVFHRNVVAYSLTNDPASGTGNVSGQNASPTGRNAPGAEGSGFWFRGIRNTIEGNESWNNPIGFNLFNTAHVAGNTLVPSTPGGTPDTKVEFGSVVPVRFSDNVAIGGLLSLEQWALSAFPNTNFVAINAWRKHYWVTISGNNHVYLVNPTMVAEGLGENNRVLCINSAAAYTSSLLVEGGYIGGCWRGLSDGMARGVVTLRDVTLQNVENIQGLPVDGALYENVMHLPLRQYPHRYLVLNETTPLAPGVQPPYWPYPWRSMRGSPWRIRNWQGAGQDYRMLLELSEASWPAWPAVEWPMRDYVPEQNLTNAQAWAKYGMTIGGDIYDAASAPAVDGAINVALVPGPSPLGPPKVVLTHPNLISTASVKDQAVLFHVVKTGEQVPDSRVFMAIDDGPEQPFRQRVAGLSNGLHRAHLRLADASGQTLFTGAQPFCVGDLSDCTGQSPPPR